MRGAASDVVVGLRETDDGAFQPDKDGVRHGGVVHLWVIAGYFVHPALKEEGAFL